MRRELPHFHIAHLEQGLLPSWHPLVLRKPEALARVFFAIKPRFSTAVILKPSVGRAYVQCNGEVEVLVKWGGQVSMFPGINETSARDVSCADGGMHVKEEESNA